MRKLYDHVNSLLNIIDYGIIWPGFFKYEFALYNGENIYFENKVIPYDMAFRGNTAINYEGKMLAIWRVNNPEKEEAKLLAGKIVHEMFHAFQIEQGESRTTDNFAILDYPDNLENYKLKHEENLRLAEAYRAKDLLKKKAFLEEFMAIRLYRADLIGEIIKQEYYTETHEGIAEYIGAMTWKQLSKELFSQKMEEYCKRIETLDESFFDMRRSLYFTGAVFACVLDEIGFPLRHEIKGQTKTVFEMASDKVSAEKCNGFSETTLELDELFKKYSQEKNEKFQSFIETGSKIVHGDFYIEDYDPMSMIKLRNMILCGHFISLKGQSPSEPLFINEPVLLELEEGSANHVVAYRVRNAEINFKEN